MKRVVVGIDGTPNSDQALVLAAEEAALRDAQLVVVHAWRMPVVVGDVAVPAVLDPAPFAEAAAATLRAAVDSIDASSLRLGVDARLVRGDAATALLDAAQDADLVVVGSKRRGRLGELLLGSVSRDVVRRANVPVVVAPVAAAGELAA